MNSIFIDIDSLYNLVKEVNDIICPLGFKIKPSELGPEPVWHAIEKISSHSEKLCLAIGIVHDSSYEYLFNWAKKKVNDLMSGFSSAQLIMPYPFAKDAVELISQKENYYIVYNAERRIANDYVEYHERGIKHWLDFWKFPESRIRIYNIPKHEHILINENDIVIDSDHNVQAKALEVGARVISIERESIYKDVEVLNWIDLYKELEKL